MKPNKSFISFSCISLTIVAVLNILIRNYLHKFLEDFSLFMVYATSILFGICAVWSLIFALKNLKISIRKKIIIGVVVTAVYIFLTDTNIRLTDHYGI
jgi:multidrug transporter EmrE-like cation transporter